MGHSAAESVVKAGLTLVPFTLTGFSAGVAVSNIGEQTRLAVGTRSCRNAAVVSAVSCIVPAVYAAAVTNPAFEPAYLAAAGAAAVLDDMVQHVKFLSPLTLDTTSASWYSSTFSQHCTLLPAHTCGHGLQV
eukprot:GHRQ01024854.1.p1 GENE.GHRQ01024854.1~~GHRQ01024854.1.p1  ORF type:complete len:132 (-),score=16.53 GHRQ01024854.1:26-421(-)